MDTLSPPWPPSVDSGGEAEQARMLQAHLTGDAKVQIADGINVLPIRYSAIWDLRRADATIMRNFFRAHAGKCFLWVMPRETVARFWLAGGWTHTVLDDYDHHRLSVSLEEQFRP